MFDLSLKASRAHRRIHVVFQHLWRLFQILEQRELILTLYKVETTPHLSTIKDSPPIRAWWITIKTVERRPPPGTVSDVCKGVLNIHRKVQSMAESLKL